MNFLYLSPQFPANYQAFCTALKSLGVTVLGLANAHYDELSPQLKSALQEYYRVDDMHHYEQLVQACQHFTNRYGPIDRLDSHAEYWLETEARLRTDFNIPGIHTDFIQNIKRKSKMKAIYQQAGVPVAEGAVCNTLAEAKAFIERVGYPVVAKPDIGVGAASTFKLHNPGELAAFFDDKPHVDYFLEEFVSGDIYSFDGLTDREGIPRFWTAHRYSDGIMEVVQQDNHVYYYSLRDIPEDLEAMGRKVLKAFNVRERFYHFEFFRRHDNQQLMALEVNIRPPGGYTTDMFNYANDFNIYQEWANVMVNNRFDAAWHRPYHVIYISRKHHLPYGHAHHSLLERYGNLLCMHTEVPGIFARALGHHAYIARSSDLNELLEMAHTVQQLETP